MLIVEGDDDCRSAGSFFKNPVVTIAEAARIEALAYAITRPPDLSRLAVDHPITRSPDHPITPETTLPRYPSKDGWVKLSAAWLVEHAGIHKGYGHGPVGISRKHTLAIVNRGGATANDIVIFKNEIQKRVLDVWGIRLLPEPVFVGLPGRRD
jgi:UDP-N-acetylmuramate dehydrogenase